MDNVEAVSVLVDCLGDMLNLVALPGQQLIKRRIDKRADLKDGRRMVVGNDSLAVMDFPQSEAAMCRPVSHCWSGAYNYEKSG